ALLLELRVRARGRVGRGRVGRGRVGRGRVGRGVGGRVGRTGHAGRPTRARVTSASSASVAGRWGARLQRRTTTTNPAAPTITAATGNPHTRNPRPSSAGFNRIDSP